MAKKVFTDESLATLVDETKSYVDSAVSEKANTSHTHNYAGSSSAGGAATSANKLNTDAGSATNPVYFANGVPVKTTYTLGKSVPSNAVFTDTTYDVATTSADGLMSSTDKTKLNYTNIAYGTCSTAAATAAKVVTVSGNTNWALTAGSMVSVYFSNTNTAENPTLNVNGTGAKNIYYGSSQITTSSLGYAGTASRLMNFIYDGTQYRFVSWGYDSNTTYTNVKLGHGYATCSTAAATTAKTATLSSYTLTTGGIVAVKFTYAVPASATLNINSKGAKSIYFRGAAITGDVIKAGDVATFIYSSQYHLISIDRWQNDITTLQTDLDTLESTVSGKANSSHTHAISDVTNLQSSLDAKVPTSRTVNGKALSSNITLSASDVGASASDHTHSSYVNQNAFSNVVVGSTTIAADTTTDSLTIAAGTGISVSGDATNDKVTITNSGVRSISTGSSNGTISVNTNGTSANVAVKGLGSAAYTASTAYDAAGTATTKADAALASAKSYTDTAISNLINSAPTTLDTLGEIATAMQENASVVEALEDAIGNKVDKVSGKGLSTNDYTTTEKNKLAGIAAGAEVNQNAFSKITIGSTNIEADSKTDTLTLVAGSNITLTPDATNDKITIAATDTTYTLGSFGVTATAAELNKLDGVTATTTELNYVDGVTSNIQTQLDGKAASSHTHTKSQITDFPSSLKNPNSLTIQGNGTTLTNGTYDGSAAKTVNITPSSIGAAASSHTHTIANITNLQSTLDSKAPAMGVAYIDENDNETITLVGDLTEIASLIGGDA